VEEEEAMALAQVQSLVEEDQPHPPISLAPPTETVIVHVQPDNVSHFVYMGLFIIVSGNKPEYECYGLELGNIPI